MSVPHKYSHLAPRIETAASAVLPRFSAALKLPLNNLLAVREPEKGTSEEEERQDLKALRRALLFNRTSKSVTVSLDSSMGQCGRWSISGRLSGEPVQIQAVVPELAVEAFDEGILGRFARLDQVQLDATVSRPEELRLAGELRTVVADEHRRQRTPVGQLVELAGQALAGDREVDDVQHAQAPPVSQLIADEVHRPSLVGPVGYGHRDSRPDQLLAPLGANLQALLAVEAIGALGFRTRPSSRSMPCRVG